MHFLLAALAGLTEAILYLLACGMTLLMAASGIYAITMESKYPGQKIVEIGRFGMGVCLLTILWAVVRIGDSMLSQGEKGLVDLIDGALRSAWMDRAIVVYPCFALVSVVLFHIGAFMAPRHLRNHILELRM